MTESIQKVLDDEKEYPQLKKFLTDKFMSEIPAFYEHRKQYIAQNDAAKRQELGDAIIAKFLTLDGDATLPDHVMCYKMLDRRLKQVKKKGEAYPKDLFDEAYDKVLFSIANVWNDYQDSRK